MLSGFRCSYPVTGRKRLKLVAESSDSEPLVCPVPACDDSGENLFDRYKASLTIPSLIFPYSSANAFLHDLSGARRVIKWLPVVVTKYRTLVCFLQFMKMSVPQLTMVWFIHNLGSAIQLVEMEHTVRTSNINIWKVACI